MYTLPGDEERLTSGIVKLNMARANPVIHNISQKAHLHPLATTAKPATIGPKVGPAAQAKSYKPMEYVIFFCEKISNNDAPVYEFESSERMGL